MAYVPQGNPLGIPAIATNHTADPSFPQRTPDDWLGTVIRAVDPTYGAGEFIFLKGVASTVVGSMVFYDANWQTALATSAAAAPGRPIAVAMAATVASQYGWYQIGGQAVIVKANTLSLAAGAGIGASSGAAIAVASGDGVVNAVVAVVASAKSDVTSVRVTINRPHDPQDVS